MGLNGRILNFYKAGVDSLLAASMHNGMRHVAYHYDYMEYFLKLLSSLLMQYFLQTYLTEEDFLEVFGISVHDYKAMPKWKQDNLKKKVDLF